MITGQQNPLYILLVLVQVVEQLFDVTSRH